MWLPANGIEMHRGRAGLGVRYILGDAVFDGSDTCLGYREDVSAITKIVLVLLCVAGMCAPVHVHLQEVNREPLCDLDAAADREQTEGQEGGHRGASKGR